MIDSMAVDPCGLPCKRFRILHMAGCVEPKGSFFFSLHESCQERICARRVSFRDPSVQFSLSQPSKRKLVFVEIVEKPGSCAIPLKCLQNKRIPSRQPTWKCKTSMLVGGRIFALREELHVSNRFPNTPSFLAAFLSEAQELKELFCGAAAPNWTEEDLLLSVGASRRSRLGLLPEMWLAVSLLVFGGGGVGPLVRREPVSFGGYLKLTDPV